MPLPRGRPKKVAMLSINEAAQTVGCHPNTVRSWVRNSELPHQRVPSRNIKIKLEDLKEFVLRKYGIEIE
jgi:excisionase family DNA binding protein